MHAFGAPRLNVSQVRGCAIDRVSTARQRLARDGVAAVIRARLRA